MIYFLTVLNAVILAIVAYLFYNFRKALESSGVRQIDEYLHELEGSVAQLTSQFERSSTNISKDLLRKTTDLQALIGECDTKLAEINRLRMGTSVTAADVLAGRPGRAPLKAAASDIIGPSRAEVTGVPSVSPAIAARRLSASEALVGKARGDAIKRNVPASGADSAASEAGVALPVAVAELSEDGLGLPEIEQMPAASGQPIAAGVGQPNEKYRLIFLLASEGMDTASIAKHTNLTRGEVEMLLDLRRQGKI
ncbi:MAG TPA: hypothetical protein VMW62_17525 [Chloroflexota bacterium]|nr:hypothetical protein [Chloroflexota bacterium]